LNGDVGSAAMLLKMRAQAIRLGDTGPLIIQIVNALPPMRYEVDNKKSRDQAQGAGSPGPAAGGENGRLEQTNETFVELTYRRREGG
jgi:hypothetical protein